MLMASIPPLLASTESVVLLLGRGASDVKDALIEGRSPLADRIHAVGELSGPDLSCYIAACDIMWQPYRDGISSRRSSAMAALAHGRPVVTTVGPLSEPLWSESGSVVMVSADRPVDMVSATAALIDDRPRQLALSIRSRELYTARFDLAHAIAALRSADHAPTAAQAS
jgi:glycosyltransferase involved in cell wall biosynthesis